MRNTEVLSRIDDLERKLVSMMDSTLDPERAAAYLGISRSTLYKMTSANVIPFSKPMGGKMVFFKSDLDTYLRSKRVGAMNEYT